MVATSSRIVAEVPDETLAWLLEPENPAVATLARRALLGESDSAETAALWADRNGYAPVSGILGAQLEDGSWDRPARDYKKYQGSLWQIHFLGELYANGDDPRVRRAAEYAFSRQLTDGSWSASNMRPNGSICCLTSNVARALARMGWADDERVVAALQGLVDLFRELGEVNCRWGVGYQLNGYCHMVTVKELLFMGTVPRELWPSGCEELRDACVAHLRDKQVSMSLPEEARAFDEDLWAMKPVQREGYREIYLAKHPELHYKQKAGWLRFGYPLSYNSDVLEALWALMQVGESPQPEYETAVATVRAAADDTMRWTLRNTFNDKMLAPVERKGQPSKWLTLRALQVLEWAS
jgi:hypothetical protein